MRAFFQLIIVSDKETPTILSVRRLATWNMPLFLPTLFYLPSSTNFCMISYLPSLLILSTMTRRLCCSVSVTRGDQTRFFHSTSGTFARENVKKDLPRYYLSANEDGIPDGRFFKGRMNDYINEKWKGLTREVSPHTGRSSQFFPPYFNVPVLIDVMY